MKPSFTIALIFYSAIAHAQFNIVEHFGNLCALGNSIQIQNDTIHIAGTTCIDIGNNQFAPSAFLTTYDLSGQILSYYQVGDTLRVYEGEKLLINSEGNKFILGDFKKDSLGNTTNQGVFIQKRNQNNQVLWTTEYQDSSSNVFYFMRNGVLLENGNIAICGAFNISNPIDTDILYMVFDSLGNVVLHKQIGVAGVQEEARGICHYDSNRIALGSVKNFPGANGNNWVLMIDYQGNVLDEYISSSNDRIGVWDIVKTQDGGLACASAASNGNWPSQAFKSYVEKLDSNLNQVWEYTIDTMFNGSNSSNAISETSNGDILVGGNVVDFLFDPDTAGKYGYLQKLSSQGDSIWFKGYNFYNNVTIRETHSLFDFQIFDGLIYFVGDANDSDTTPPPGQSMWLVRTDSNGNINSLDQDQNISFNNLKVYPNPSSDNLIIEIDSIIEDVLFCLYDLNGILQFRQILKSDMSAISLSELPPGLYIYEVGSEGNVKRGRIIKK